MNGSSLSATAITFAIGSLFIFSFVFLFGCTTSVPVNCINVTCNGVTTCRAPNNIPPCVPPIPTPDNSTSGNRTVAVNLAQELNNSAEAGFSLNAGMFYASSSSECSKQLISPCDNNVPNQFICVSQQYAGTVSSQYGSIYPTPRACPEFLLAGSVYCGLNDNYCVVYQETN
jgi:hypothetical protein